MQIGLGTNSIQLGDVSLEQQRIVDALYSGIVSGQESAVDLSLGALSGTTQNLIERLSDILEKPSETKGSAFGPWQQLAFSEIARAALNYEVNGEMVLAERWQRNVHIDQLDRSGWVLARTLLASGIGSVVTHDDGKVLLSDLGELGYPKETLNSNRVDAANQELLKYTLVETTKRRLTELQVPPSQDTKVDFAIVIGHLALDPTRYARWMNRDVPHLAIIFGLEEVEVSPIIQPGKTGCLNCYQQTKIDQDQSWPVLASQLLYLPRVRDDSASLLTSAGLGLQLILRYLDLQAGFQPKDGSLDTGSGYRINHTTGLVTRTKYSFHPSCSCAELD